MKRINLIPLEKRAEYNWFYITKTFLIRDFPPPIMIALLILFLVGTFQFVDAIRLKLSISSRKNKIALLDKESNKYEKLYLEIKSEKEAVLRSRKHMEDKMAAIRRIKQEAHRWSAVLEDIAKIIPLNVSLQSVTLNKDGIIITGTTLNNLVVSKFMQLLDDSGNFKDTNFTYTRKEEMKDEEDKQYEIINFGLTTYLERQYGL